MEWAVRRSSELVEVEDRAGTASDGASDDGLTTSLSIFEKDKTAGHRGGLTAVGVVAGGAVEPPTSGFQAEMVIFLPLRPASRAASIRSLP